MNIELKLKEMQESAKELLAEGIITPDGCISLRENETMLITADGADLSKLSAASVSEVNLTTLKAKGTPAAEYKIHAAVYNGREDLDALIRSTQKSVLTSSIAGKTVKPMLDDMAQIAGITVKVSNCSNEAAPKETKKLVKSMKGRHSVFLKDRGILCGSVNLHEAHAVCMVMDKACKSFIESEFLGGGVCINRAESALMRFIYLKKYSKQADKNR